MLTTILVAVDDSEGARRATAFARDLALQTGAKLILLLSIELPNVVPFGALDSYLLAPQHPSPEHVNRARAEMLAMVAALPEGQVSTRVESGPPADAICRVGAEVDASLIVVGARGLSAPGRWLLGSVSEKVVRHAGRPVTVVH